MLGKYDISLKCVEIRKLLDNRNYKKALSILETLDTDKVKNITDLNAFADVYRKTEQYDLAEEMLLRVYEKSPTYRVIYKLVIVSLKRGNLSAAEEYYKDYIEVAPETAEKYILEYRVKKAKHSDYKDRIQTLEELKKIDYMEEWAYELAKLYHKAGMSDRCIEECDDIVLWFSEGIIVEKAKMLRAYYIDGADILSRTRQRTKPISKPAKEIKSSKDMILDTMDLSAQISELKDNEYKREVAQQLAGDLEPTVDVGKAMKQELIKESKFSERVDLYDIQEKREKRKKFFFRGKQIEEESPKYVEEDRGERLQQEQLLWGTEELAATQEAYQINMEPELEEEQPIQMSDHVEEGSYMQVQVELEEQAFMQRQPELKEEYSVQMEPELEEYATQIEPELKEEYSAQMEAELEEEYTVQIEPELKEEYSVQMEPELEEYATQIEPELKEEYATQIEPELKEEYVAQMEAELEEEHTVQIEPRLKEEHSIQISAGMEEWAFTQSPVDIEEANSMQMSVDLESYSEQAITDLEKEQFMKQPIDWQEEQFEEEHELSEDELRLQAEFNEDLRKKMMAQSKLNKENLQEEYAESNWDQQMEEEETGIQLESYQENIQEEFTGSDCNQQMEKEETGIEPETYQEKFRELNESQEVIEKMESPEEVIDNISQGQISSKQEIDMEAISKTYSQKISVKLNSAQQQAVLQSRMKAKELQKPEIKVNDTDNINSLEEKASIQNQEVKESILKDEFMEKDIYNQQVEQEESKESVSRFLVGKIDVSIFLEQYAEDEILSEQLYKLLSQLENVEEPPHFIITANKEEDAVEFTKNLAKVLQKIEFMRSSRIAKIQAAKLNRMNLESKQTKLMDSTLLIEKAGEMYRPTVTNILALLKEMHDRLTIVLQGTFQEIEILLEENYDLREAFLYRIDL